MSTKVDVPVCDIQVHQEVNDPGLQVSIDQVHLDLFADIDQLDKGYAFLDGECFIDLFIVLDTFDKVTDGFLGICASVIRRR